MTRPTWQRVSSWLAERTGVQPLIDFLSKKTVPVHRHSGWYLAGGAALFLLIVQVVTGILLALHYQPTEDMAYDSVRVISTELPFGWLIRSVHHWGANLLVGVLALHLASTFFMRAYRRPRELLWATGCLALVCVLGMGFSGYLMPWDELAFFATKVGTRIPGTIPFVGDIQMKLLRGGEQVTGATLTRFYAAHLVVLPLALGAIVGVHVLLIQMLGISRPPWLEEQQADDREMKFFPDFLLLDGIVWATLFGVLITLAVLLPAGLGVRADPMRPAPAGIRPEWYLLFMFETLKHIPGRLLFIDGETVGVLAFTLAGLFVLVIPFVATTPERQRRLNWLALAALIFVVVATAVSLVSGEALAQNKVVADANRLTFVRVAGVVWTWAMCAWIIAALTRKWRHRRWLGQVGYLKDVGSQTCQH